MGKASSKLSNIDAAHLERSTHFDKKELQQWYKGFMKDCPRGALSRAEFKDLYKQYFPFGDSSAYSDHVFDLFDVDKNGTIDFNEFMTAISVTSKGTSEEKLQWAFKLYDLDGDGYVTQAELQRVVSALYKTVGNSLKHAADEDTPEKRAEKMFLAMDVNGNGCISLTDFVQGVHKEENVIHALGLFNMVM
ncbi:putative neuronal calcium sensor NCS-1 [Chytriomyces sp. MP71]|nr:putative neuronal calcium sensor NCS-1 [Chytriomyces sp. MP71]